MDVAWRVLACVLCGVSGTVHAWQAGDWVLRAGAVRVEPHESGGTITLGAAGRVPGSALHFDDDTQPMLALSWMVTDAVGIELLAANPTRHVLSATGVTPQALELGSVRPLAPTLVALWFPLAGQGAWQPFLGIGAGHVRFFGLDIDAGARATLGASDLRLRAATGLALRAGFDWEIGERWALHAGLSHLAIGTEAALQTAIGRAEANVDLDPWLYTLGVAWRLPADHP